MDVNVKGGKCTMYKRYRITLNSGVTFEVTATRLGGALALAEMQCGIYDEVTGVIRLSLTK